MKLTDYPRSSVTLLAGLALAACALLLFSWLAEEVFKGDTRLFDEQTRAFVNGHAAPSLTVAMRGVTYLGSTVVVAALCVCAVLAFYLMKWRRAAVLLLITMVGAGVLNNVLKLSFHRARPDPFFGIVAPLSYSFPSGHSLLSFCLFGTLAAVIHRRTRSTTVRIVVWMVAALLVALVGFSRVYLGVHYPSDVLAGYLAAAVWVLAVAFGDRLSRRDEREAKD
jgi:undecaprenyl-diphosphatase